MFLKEVKKRTKILVASILFLIITWWIEKNPTWNFPIQTIILSFILIVVGTFLLKKYATPYQIYYLFAVLFLGFLVLSLLAFVFPLAPIPSWGNFFILVSLPTFYITIMRPKQGWAIGIIVSLLVIISLISSTPIIPLEAIYKTLKLFVFLTIVGIVCGLLGEYIGKRLKSRKGVTEKSRE